LTGGEGSDLIYCDCLYGHRTHPPEILPTKAKRRRIDKGGFLLRRSIFTGFSGKKENAPSEADGILVEEVAAAGHSIVKVQGVLWVHNP
jgi:hypothetical protein